MHNSPFMFKLMSDEKTGSIIAAPEFDEHFTRCGGYAYAGGAMRLLSRPHWIKPD
jgi:hypothetical protein